MQKGNSKTLLSVVVLVIIFLAVALIAYFYRTNYSKYTDHIENDTVEYTEGNYSKYKCEWPIALGKYCNRSCVCEVKFKDGSDTEHYCSKHLDIVKGFYKLNATSSSQTTSSPSSTPRPIEDYYLTIDPDESEDDFWLGVTTAQNLVKDELKSPSTAKFPLDTSAYSVEKSFRNKWIVKGYVDAQNGFGATVREYWTATFTITDLTDYNYNVKNYKVTFS